MEENISETQGDADADAGTHAALAFFAGETHADEGEDEGGEGSGEAFVVFHFKRTDAGCSAEFLSSDELFELGDGHGFLLIADVEEVLGFHEQHGVESVSALEFLAHSLQCSDVIVSERPGEAALGEGIIFNALRRQVGHEFLVLELVEREAVAALRDVVEVGDICHDARIHLHLDIIDGSDFSAFSDVAVLEVDARDVALGNDVGAEDEGGEGDDARADHVGAEQASETHARGFHRNYLAVVGEFGSEENDGDENEEGAEEVGEVGNEIDVVVEDNLLHRGVTDGEFVDFLVVVEDDGNHDDDGDEEDVGAEELVDDVSVNPSNHWFASRQPDFLGKGLEKVPQRLAGPDSQATKRLKKRRN